MELLWMVCLVSARPLVDSSTGFGARLGCNVVGSHVFSRFLLTGVILRPSLLTGSTGLMPHGGPVVLQLCLIISPLDPAIFYLLQPGCMKRLTRAQPWSSA